MTQKSSVTFGAPFARTPDQDFVCTTWFERDRSNVRLTTPRGRVVFDLWDEAVSEAIEDGYLKAPRCPRSTDADWQPHAVQCARSWGLIQ